MPHSTSSWTSRKQTGTKKRREYYRSRVSPGLNVPVTPLNNAFRNYAGYVRHETAYSPNDPLGHPTYKMDPDPEPYPIRWAQGASTHACWFVAHPKGNTVRLRDEETDSVDLSAAHSALRENFAGRLVRAYSTDQGSYDGASSNMGSSQCDVVSHKIGGVGQALAARQMTKTIGKD